MDRNGEIIIIEDDQDDRDFLHDIFQSLEIPNKLVFFEDPTEVVPYLSNLKSKPFMVLSDINMPKLNGFELRRLIMKNESLSQICTPYIFLSTSQSPENIAKAYGLSAHGYFKKQSSFKDSQLMIGEIITYWKSCFTPSLNF